MDLYKFGVLVTFCVFTYLLICYEFSGDPFSQAELKSFENWLEDVEKTNIIVDKTCKKYGKLLSEVQVNYKSFLYNPAHKILMCRNAKVIFVRLSVNCDHTTSGSNAMEASLFQFKECDYRKMPEKLR